MYGPMDDSSKFLVWLVKEMLNERNQIINLTSGIQKRDFLYIDDVVEVFNLIINNKNNLKGFNEYEVGTGVLTTVKDFVFKVANHIEKKTNLKIISKLNFGYFPYRNNEIMEPELNNSKLVQLGWIPKFDLEKGLKKTLKEYL